MEKEWEQRRAEQDKRIEQMKAEQEEEASFLLLTILDEDERVVRCLRAPARDGLQRMVWDLRYPAFNPTATSQAGATTSSPPGTLALPGTYKVKLSLFREGSEVKLSDQPPVEFLVKPLNNATLPAEDRAALVAFHSVKRVAWKRGVLLVVDGVFLYSFAQKPAALLPLTAFLVVFWRLAREKYVRELV